MYDDLIIVTYLRTMEAMMAWVRLHLLHGNLPLGIDTAMILTVNETGKAYALQVSDLTDFPCGPEMRFLGSLIRQVIDHEYEPAGIQLIDAGIEETFLTGLSQAITPGSSAIIYYAPAGGFVDVSQLLTVLSQEHGIIHHTTLTPTTAERIRELAKST